MASLFAAPSSATQTRDLYQQLGLGNVAADVARVAGRPEAADRHPDQAAGRAAGRDGPAGPGQTTARQGAEAVSAQSEATLAQVKGNLAAQIAQQAAAQAAGGGPGRGHGHHPAAAQAAAAQAAQAAQVATTVSGGSAAAVNATTAANQATNAAGAARPGLAGSGAVTVSASGSAQAAGPGRRARGHASTWASPTSGAGPARPASTARA